jgi:hypothetical protein
MTKKILINKLVKKLEKLASAEIKTINTPQTKLKVTHK